MLGLCEKVPRLAAALSSVAIVLPVVKNWCMDTNTIDTPMAKCMESECPNNAADINAVNIVATVLLYFFKMVSANLKKSELRIPCMALFTTKISVTRLYPEKMGAGFVVVKLVARSPH